MGFIMVLLAVILCVFGLFAVISPSFATAAVKNKMTFSRAKGVGALGLGLVLFFVGVVIATKDNVATDSTAVSSAKEEVKITVADDAFVPWTKADSPKLYKKWGAKGIDKVNKMMPLAIDLVVNNADPKLCSKIDVASVSIDNSSPKTGLLMFVDCLGGERYYITEADIEQNKLPLSESQKNEAVQAKSTDYIMACRDLVKSNLHYPSSFDPSVLSSDVSRMTDDSIVVMLPFEAKNGLGIEVPQVAYCSINGDMVKLTKIENR